MSNDVIVEALSRVASSMMLWAFIRLQDLKSFASELHHWFVAPKDRFNAEPPPGFAVMLPDPQPREGPHGQG